MAKLKDTSREVINKTNINKIGAKALNLTISVVTEVILIALAIQGLLSEIHAQRKIQIGVSFTFVILLLISRYRSK